MSPLWKSVRILIFFIFTWVFIIGGTIGMFFLVRDTLTQNNTEVAIAATVSFLIVPILIGEKFANMVNCMLTNLMNQDAPSCVKNEEVS